MLFGLAESSQGRRGVGSPSLLLLSSSVSREVRPLAFYDAHRTHGLHLLGIDDGDSLNSNTSFVNSAQMNWGNGRVRITKLSRPPEINDNNRVT